MLIIVFHTSSVLVTFRATKKYQNYFRPGKSLCSIFPKFGGSFARSQLLWAGIGDQNEKVRFSPLPPPPHGKCSTSSLSVRQRLSSIIRPFNWSSHLAILAMRTSISPCLKNLKQIFLFLISCLPGNAHNAEPRLVRRQDLFLQFSCADFRAIAVLQIL